MNLDLYLTTDELARLIRKEGMKDPSASAIKWARRRGLTPADGGRTLLWLKDDVMDALHRRPRRAALRRTV